MDEIAAHDRFVLHQRFRLMINQYEFHLADEDGTELGEPVCFVEQKRFKFKEDIRFFADDSKRVELMRILARQRFDPRARYDIALADGTELGQIQKVFGKSLLRSSYVIYAPDGAELATAREVSGTIAVIRRFIGLIPFIGDILELLPIAYDFEFRRGEERIGINRRRRWRFRDTYDIDLSADPDRTVDRRLALAAVVGMDALQAR